MGELYETNYLNKASIIFSPEKKKKQAWWHTFVNTTLRSWETRASEIQNHHCLYIKIKTRTGEHENCLSFYILREYYILQKKPHNFINYTIR